MPDSHTQPILFVGYDASRTGAPLLLLHLLRWLKTHTDIPFQILLQYEGELISEFEALAPVTIFHKEFPLKQDLYSKIARHFGFQKDERLVYLQHVKKKFLHKNIALIYCNTIANGRILEELMNLSCPIICHVHELEYAIQYYGIENFELVKKHVQHYIAVSKAVKQNLINNHNISEANIDVIYEYLPIQSRRPPLNNTLRKHICQQLKIPLNAMIVCASGTIDWRKGADLFIQLAQILYKKYPASSIHFLWIGEEREFTQRQFLHDLTHLELDQYVHFLGTKSNPLDYFLVSDVFVLVSREDPFPLVCLEAASLGKPIICFDRAGGAQEFVEDDAGFVVPYLDIEDMAEKVIALISSQELRQRLGLRAQQKVQTHDIEVIAPQILHLIKKFLV